MSQDRVRVRVKMWSVLPRSLIEDIFSVFWGEGKVIGQVLTGWMSFAVELAVSEH